ncbi:DinB family protein [Amycolatopsis rhabdoformis]|uniref:DinB family protein n=1 Tax=Amycolatopsis rhabdoformis TaxID=1448059 RepID=A0ABZ1IKW0_9PSEU|nr:DinB family protein [Amycolatopsis rhabdoformis]WSE34367.1 DinB family protein [Amycolatopsis rhabdoformis]
MTTPPAKSAPPERLDPPMDADERTQLTMFLDYLRASVVWKCSGLTDEQARRRLVPSELTTISGLLGHLALVENWWFRVVLDGQPDEWAEALAQDPDAEFRVALTTPIEQLIAGYEAEVALSREIVAAREFTDTVRYKDREDLNVRWVVTHLIEETARHLGHLDLLRELTDGLTGE